MLGLTVAISGAAFAQSVPSSESALSEFFRSMDGEWVGTCQQTTDGEEAENKYFHAVVRQLGPNTFESQFEYYRLDRDTGDSLWAGETTVTTTVGSDGNATNKIVGKGTVLVYDKPKDQQHEMTEVVESTSEGRLQGQGTGTISVSGMPLGLGKRGKISEAESYWFLEDGVLTVHQTLNVGFRVLLFKKNFTVVAHYTARRGSDVAALMTGTAQVSAGPEGGVGDSS